jgi:hypothetical protein
VIDVTQVTDSTVGSTDGSRKRKFNETEEKDSTTQPSDHYPDYSDYITVNGKDSTESPTLSTTNALRNLAVSDTYDLTQSDTEYDHDSEAGDCILLYTASKPSTDDTTIV